MSQQVRVRVPATTANLGPGFDALGLALRLYNVVEMQRRDEPDDIIVLTGEGETTLPRDATNIVVQAADVLFREVGLRRAGLQVQLINNLPLSRGLGSSAAARVAGLMAANELAGRPLNQAALLRLATQLEGHPDNAAAALLGGLVSSCLDEDGSVHAVKLTVSHPPRFIVLIPDIEVATHAARDALPHSVSLRDAVFNVSRACLLVSALVTGDRAALRAALRDRLHQPYRSRLMPWLDAVIAAAIDAGAYGAVLSGAGSSVLAMADEPTADIANAMLQTLRAAGHHGSVRTLEIDEEGAVIE
ncbi:MAG: homoserine kinase [Abditibacteriales bacterium]|nr:homoserine kinase [Abditibacteriales bacterium]MDW8364340.1 homoserine kinase [Abditibacteriales bacterium]